MTLSSCLSEYFQGTSSSALIWLLLTSRDAIALLFDHIKTIGTFLYISISKRNFDFCLLMRYCFRVKLYNERTQIVYSTSLSTKISVFVFDVITFIKSMNIIGCMYEKVSRYLTAYPVTLCQVLWYP